MFYEIEILSHLGFIVMLLFGVEKLFNTKIGWKETLRLAILLFIAFVVYYKGASTVASFTDGLAKSFLEKNDGNHAHIIMYGVAVVTILGLAWYVLARWLIVPESASSNFLLAVAAIIFGLLYLSEVISDIREAVILTTGAEYYFYALVGLFILGISIALIKLHKDIQEFIAIPVGFMILAGIWAYVYFHATGINLVSSYNGYDQHYAYGPFIVIGIALLFSTVFYREKPWHKRASYKFLYFFAIIGMLYGLFSSAAFLLGAFNPVEWERTQAVNKGLKRQLDAKTKKVGSFEQSYTVVVNGNSYTKTVAWADNIIDDPDSSLEEIDVALAIAKASKDEVALVVENQEELQFTGNTGRILKWSDKMIKGSIKATGDLIDYGKGLMPKKSNSEINNGVTNHTQVKVYRPGVYNIYLEAGEITDHWITFPRGRLSNFQLSSSDFKYIVIFDDGRTFNCWEIKSFPRRSHHKFKIRAVTNQNIKLAVS